MKRLLLTILLFSSSHAFCQDTKIEFTQVDSISDTKVKLFVKARQWINENFKNRVTDPNEIIDADAGRIVASGFVSYPRKGVFGNVASIEYISFKIVIDVRENKYRIVLSDYRETGSRMGGKNGDPLEGKNPFGFLKKEWEDVNKVAIEKSKALLQTLKSSMTKVDDF